MPTPDSSPDRSRRNLDHGRQGFVYVLSSRVMRTPKGEPLIKIGCTRKHPLQRAKELAAGSGVPDAFQIAYYRDYVDCFLAESMAHEHFSEARYSHSREFFAVPVSAAVAFLDGLPNSSTYRDLASEGVTGGENAPDYGAPVETPFADLFATFPDDHGPRELTADERAACGRLFTEQIRGGRQ